MIIAWDERLCFPPWSLTVDFSRKPRRSTHSLLVLRTHKGQTLAARLEHACDAARRTHRHWTLGASYSSFADALEQATPPLDGALKRRFRRKMLRIAGPCRERGRWMAFAADGPFQSLSLAGTT